MQVLYGILVQHFAIRAATVPVPLAELDALTQQLLEMTGEVPLYAATVARARLAKLQERLSSVLQDPSSGELCCHCLALTPPVHCLPFLMLIGAGYSG